MPIRPFRLTIENPKESDRQAEILRYLLHEPSVKFVIRINGGGRFIKDSFVWFYKLFVPGYEARGKGVSDLIGQLRDGRFFAIECKRSGEKATKDQTVFLQLVKECGGPSGVAETWHDARRIIKGETQS